MLQRLTVFAVHTGTWTAVFALLSLLFVSIICRRRVHPQSVLTSHTWQLYVLPLENLYSVFGIPLCPVYCNTLLANLNARVYLKDGSIRGHISVASSAALNANGQPGEVKFFVPPEVGVDSLNYYTSIVDDGGWNGRIFGGLRSRYHLHRMSIWSPQYWRMCDRT